MARLVEIGVDLPRTLTLEPGDLLNLPASGGLVESGKTVIEPFGPFTPGVVGTDGRVLSPETVPTNMIFRAARPGRARLAVFSGTGLVPAGRAVIDIIVEEGAGPQAA